MPIAIVLVLIGIAALGVGVFTDTIGWVYASIASTAVAGVVLFFVHRANRRPILPDVLPPQSDARSEVASAETTELPAAEEASSLDAGVSECGTGFSVGAGAEAGEVLPSLPSVPSVPSLPSLPEPVPGGEQAGGTAFPIADYDELRVAEVLPLLPALGAAELATVRDHENRTKHRATVLARIEELAGDAGPSEVPE
jgi:hypothetical protein